LRSIVALAFLAPPLLAWSAHTLAADGDCSTPLGATPPPADKTPAAQAPTPAPPADTSIHVHSEGGEVKKNGDATLEGNVEITQGNREIKTRNATYEANTQQFSTEDKIDYSDDQVHVHGTGAEFKSDGGGTFRSAEFEMKQQPARGSAKKIQVEQDGDAHLDDVRYTTCPVGNRDWMIKAGHIDIDQSAGTGLGRNVSLEFKGVPILYAPILSFPVSNERKSGFLFPTPGTSSRSGAQLSVPWYWNIAPSYDATITPTWYSERGLDLGTEFRFLTSTSKGIATAEYLPHDDKFGDSRTLARIVDQTNFSEHVRLDVDAANVTDQQWFEDFGEGPTGTSINYLSRAASLRYFNAGWEVGLRAQNYQTIDDTIASADRPYTIVPALTAQAYLPDRFAGTTFAFDGELSHFDKSTGALGTRLDVAPQISLPLRGHGIYLEPSASWRYIAYRLKDTAPGTPESPTLSVPTLSVDSGMVFEKLWGATGTRLQTLEPRLMYVYTPYRDQSNLPVFDTNLADLNLVQLFRTNRYVGGDRVGDANQIDVGVTSRLLDADNGQQFVSATIGQSYFFKAPRVTLPGETTDDKTTSDIVAELNVTAYHDWNVGLGVQWDTGSSRSEKGDIHFQYAPAGDKVVNVGYRFRRDNIEQIDSSVSWPFLNHWAVYARAVYSLDEDKSLERFGGIEYRSCCWAVRLIGRNYVKNRDGQTDTTILLQLELKGLSNVGDDADAFLERSIQGYSSARNRASQPQP
jgi:LPS-assembly protein